jgi:hypothetical protein
MSSKLKQLLPNLREQFWLQRDQAASIDARQPTLPGLSQASWFLTSAASLSIVNRGLEDISNSILGDIAGAVGTGVENAFNVLAGDIVSALGIKQWYSLYPDQFCSGNYSPSYTAENAKLNTSSCQSLRCRCCARGFGLRYVDAY